jgi:hypothetical protein
LEPSIVLHVIVREEGQEGEEGVLGVSRGAGGGRRRGGSCRERREELKGVSC